MSFSSFFSSFGRLIYQAVSHAKSSGISDEVVAVALPYIRDASMKYVDNAERREWVVKLLVDRGIPESIARLGVELAFQLYKKEIGKLGNPEAKS